MALREVLYSVDSNVSVLLLARVDEISSRASASVVSGNSSRSELSSDDDARRVDEEVG